MTDLNRAKYSGADFASITDDLTAQMQANFAATFNDFVVSSAGIMLIDIVAFGLDTLSFYVDRRINDQYLVTSRTSPAVSRMAEQLGYKMAGAIASSTDVQVAIAVPVAFAVTIPALFQFQGPNSLVFESSEPVTFAPGSGPSSPQTIPCYQGQTFSDTFTSDGTANQVFNLRRVPSGQFVVQGTVSVLVNGTPYTESEFLTYDAGTTEQFQIGYNNSPPTLLFGNGITGKIPPLGATIQATYIASSGVKGRVNAHTITAEQSPLVVNFTTISLSVDNPSGSVGGDDPENISRVQSFAGKKFKSRQVAVVDDDYEALAGSYSDPLFGAVAAAKAFSSTSAASDLTLQDQIAIINSAVTTPAPIVAAAVADSTAQITAIATAITAITAALTTIGTDVNGGSGILTNIANAITNARSAKNSNLNIAAEATTIVSAANTANAFVTALPTGTPSQLTAADLLTLQGYLNNIVTEAGSVTSDSTAVSGSITSLLSQLGTAQDKATDIGNYPTGPTGQLATISTQETAITAATAAITTDNSTITSTVNGQTSTVTGATTAIYNHVDAILASDCQANLVTVPILSRDSSGFLTAPSAGLIHSLQNYLDARKEITQSVSVVSGANYLVKAVITTRVGVFPGYSQSTVAASVANAIDGLLKVRPFGQSLYVSDGAALVRSVAGVAYCNFVINGSYDPTNAVVTTYLDVNGNLIIDTSQVVSKGLVTINTELAPVGAN